MTLLVLLLTVSARAELMTYTANFSITGFEPQWSEQWWPAPEPTPTENVVGGFTYLWDQTSALSTATLLSFNADFGNYTSNWDDIGYFFQDNGEFRIGNETISGINGLRSNSDDYYINGNVFSKIMFTVGYSSAGQEALTSYWNRDNQPFSVSDGLPYDNGNGTVPTPEPSTFILLGAGLIGLLGLGRKRMKA
jgi:hypothetical protein